MAATRRCTRCQDGNGIPTGTVLGGTCFLCNGSGTIARHAVSAADRAAGRERLTAINALRDAGITRRAAAARAELEEMAPERHAKMISSVLAGRVSAVIAGLLIYADERGL